MINQTKQKAPVRHQCRIGAPKIGRRALLQSGACAALAPFLPVLESRAQDGAPPKRILFCYQANGTVHQEWKPSGIGADFEFNRILAPLENHKKDLLVLSGLDLEPEPAKPHSGHPQLFSNVPADMDRFRLCPSITLDQYIAQQRQDNTRFSTLELGIVPFGGDDFYTREILFRGPYDPVPWEPSPYAAFDRVFGTQGGAGNSDGIDKRLALRQRILDGVKNDLNRLQSKLGMEDRALMQRHEESIVQLENRFRQSVSICDGPNLGEPLDFRSVANYREMAQLQMDMMVSAFACDATRVGTLIWSGPTSTQPFPWLGDFGNNHHVLSHDPNQIEALIQINTWYSEQHKVLIDKLKSVPEPGGGTLFDNTVIFFANPLSDGNAHRKIDLPLMLAGGKWHFNTGRYIDFESKPHGHLLVSLAHAMGLDIDSFGEPETGTGALNELL
ncbi:DUF1552 domain-containing protein [Marinagarivorans cellulosilyticus]|uniref:DUF1552 domain-containing protein n=1 Tax=Marinagarivorans cellulosilyticus TaxID=2721545 RepID=A0AAN2BLH4_9GAMM|nr:DUF1552 domain-containing protein [Marinagarivorans cellulosilyticus]BCD99062.1 hypothetical protein MARGE09_P3263 [Marinagarivorans cellulosilyticus]